jgi:hypothetical protein
MLPQTELSVLKAQIPPSISKGVPEGELGEGRPSGISKWVPKG